MPRDIFKPCALDIGNYKKGEFTFSVSSCGTIVLMIFFFTIELTISLFFHLFVNLGNSDSRGLPYELIPFSAINYKLLS
jgi:hypothetical protein